MITFTATKHNRPLTGTKQYSLLTWEMKHVHMYNMYTNGTVYNYIIIQQHTQTQLHIRLHRTYSLMCTLTVAKGFICEKL